MSMEKYLQPDNGSVSSNNFHPISLLTNIYKMHIPPHLDYSDIIFHSPVITNNFDSSMSLNLTMGIFERTHCQAALAITGTNRNKMG